ncbi:hypothetical protein HPB47_002060 [Ixodes persulcatus]|uniref:Uncharacterized protein n=1 Tax=Ixodes persulcatus TaxID=34615 RepID=A0AC60PNU5_IXOPE|nr:hypothetical protein HPB47_002060 [Ixodes persulcatus]
MSENTTETRVRLPCHIAATATSGKHVVVARKPSPPTCCPTVGQQPVTPRKHVERHEVPPPSPSVPTLPLFRSFAQWAKCNRNHRVETVETVRPQRSSCQSELARVVLCAVAFSTRMAHEVETAAAAALALLCAVDSDDEMPPTKKPRSKWTSQWLQRVHQQGAYENLMRELALEDSEAYRRWIRMDTGSFEELLARVPSSPAEWKAVAQGYQDLWQFPHCVGALDGKHVALVPPHETGAQFRNYKGFFSIVLMALVDADLNFIFVDVGRNGRMNDSGIWGACKLKETLERQPSILPDAELLPRSRESAPYVIVGDEGFGLKPYLMRPYPAAELTTDKRLFNYRLSRARRTSENAFGVLVNRWQIYRSPLRHEPKRATDIVLATVALHNFLRSKRITRQLYTPQDSLDVEDILTGNVRNGSWRQGVTPAGAMRQFRRGGSNSSDNAKAVRNLFLKYFVNEGQVSWQWRMIP